MPNYSLPILFSFALLTSHRIRCRKTIKIWKKCQQKIWRFGTKLSFFDIQTSESFLFVSCRTKPGHIGILCEQPKELSIQNNKMITNERKTSNESKSPSSMFFSCLMMLSWYSVKPKKNLSRIKSIISTIARARQERVMPFKVSAIKLWK